MAARKNLGVNRTVEPHEAHEIGTRMYHNHLEHKKRVLTYTKQKHLAESNELQEVNNIVKIGVSFFADIPT